jgi:hypothetical protein
MRKLLGSLFLSLIVAALVPTLAAGTHSNGEGPDKDFVSGAAKGTLPTPCPSIPGLGQNRPAHFEANGWSTSPTGFPAQGHFFTTVFSGPSCVGTVHFDGDIICVNAALISGNNGANWRGRVTNSDTPLVPPGANVIARHVDNGEGANDPEDQSVGFPTSPGQTCPSIQFTSAPISQGNLVVHDGI